MTFIKLVTAFGVTFFADCRKAIKLVPVFIDRLC